MDESYVYGQVSEKEHISVGDIFVKNLGKETNIKQIIDFGDKPSSLYLLLTNYDEIESDEIVEITHTAKQSTQAKFIDKQQKVVSVFDTLKSNELRTKHSPRHIQNDNNKLIPNKLVLGVSAKGSAQKIMTAPQKVLKDSVGDSVVFYLSTETEESTIATARKIVSNIETKFGNKTLNIWVSNNSFGEGCDKNYCVTQLLVDQLANKFLKAGLDNDIYDWVTSVYGEEWGDTQYANLIKANDEITILLTDINNDNEINDTTAGYFWSKDNYVRTDDGVAGSNERIIFYIDSVLYANTDHGDQWQKNIYATLVHEFQHMIHYYQKGIKQGASSYTWMNEMLSEATEYLLQNKVQYALPRGVDYSDGSAGDKNNSSMLYSYFNAHNSISLTTWGKSYEDYANVSSFGAFLARNYGGAKVLHDIMHNDKTNHSAIDVALASENKSFDEMLREWGVAVLLSDREEWQGRASFNDGDFVLNSFNSVLFKLGSINFYNYGSKPTVNLKAGVVEPHSNYYYKVGDNLTGEIEINIKSSATTGVTLIAK